MAAMMKPEIKDVKVDVDDVEYDFDWAPVMEQMAPVARIDGIGLARRRPVGPARWATGP
jgi:hypothetical protein